MSVFRRPRPSCPKEVIDGLNELLCRSRSEAGRRFVMDMLLYAQIGKDRRKLTMGWVAETRRRWEAFENYDLTRLV